MKYYISISILLIQITLLQAWSKSPSLLLKGPVGNAKIEDMDNVKKEVLAFIIHRTSLSLLLQAPEKIQGKGLYYLNVKLDQSSLGFDLQLTLGQIGGKEVLNRVVEESIQPRRLIFRTGVLLEKLLYEYLENSKDKPEGLKTDNKATIEEEVDSSESEEDRELKEMKSSKQEKPKAALPKKKLSIENEVSKNFVSPDLNIQKDKTLKELIGESDPSQLTTNVKVVYATSSQEVQTFRKVNSNVTFFVSPGCW